MDLINNPDNPILIGPYKSIVVVWHFMHTMRKLKLDDKKWAGRSIVPEDIRSSYLYITKERMIFTSKGQLIHFIKNPKNRLGMLYER